VGIAHDDVADAAFARDQDTDLAAGLTRDRRQMSRQLGGDDTLGWNAAPERPFKGAPLRLLQAAQVTGDRVSGDEPSPARWGEREPSMRRLPAGL